MAARPEDDQRRIIPRWRTFRQTARMGELAHKTTKSTQRELGDGASFERSLDEWRKLGGLTLAADAFGAALVLGRAEEARDAGQFILTQGEGASKSTRSLLTPFLPPEDTADDGSSEMLATDSLHGAVARIRRRLVHDPRNAVAWVDLGLCQTILGNRRSAEKAVRAALATAKDDRFVLRSASRFLLHVGKPDEAHDILRRAVSIRSDPWLLAAEIAVASRAGRTSQFAKIGLSVANGDLWHPFQTTELSSALATLELTNGKALAARKLFRRALAAPTENSVAQVEWASRKNIGLEITEQALSTPRSFEARAKEARATGAWELSLKEAKLWFGDQPFSKEAAALASYVASVPLERYAEAAEVAQRGLVAAPREPLLLNNLAFILASMGKTDEAIEVFKQISTPDASSFLTATLVATQGLLYYRSGDSELGRQQYLHALEIAKANNAPFEAALAALFFAREALLARADHADDAWKLALEECEGRTEPEIVIIKDRLLLARSQRPAQLSQ